MDSQAGKIFVQEFVIGFGFLGGTGLDPVGLIFKALSPFVITTEPNLGFIFWLIPIVLFVVSFLGAFFMGGVVGLSAVGIAALGGWQLNNPSGVVVWLVFISIFIGLVAPYAKEKIGF